MGRWEGGGRRKVGEVVGKWKGKGGRKVGEVQIWNKKNIKNNYKKMERKKIVMWTLMWLNMSATALNATL